MKTMKHFLFIAACALSLMSCGREIPTDFDYGKVEENTYTNDFFGLTMEIPDGWHVQDQETQKILQNEGANAIGGEKLAKAIKAAEITSANLLMASQFDLATYQDPKVLNSNFTLVAENLGISSATIKDGDAYLEVSKKQFRNNNVPIEIKGDTKKIDIDGKTFHYFDGVLTMQGLKIKQRYMSTILNGFAILYVATYGSDDQLENLMQVLNTTRFK
ncbi:hypothetical protein [Aureibaculum luteum]|uniref:hypothetical protein n=1 Tax=Aureibaculum luteum TaxID=1548456 RepID=UPI00130052E4|nr:hypothetical protein [Aureibaculum luteum]